MVNVFFPHWCTAQQNSFVCNSTQEKVLFTWTLDRGPELFPGLGSSSSPPLLLLFSSSPPPLLESKAHSATASKPFQIYPLLSTVCSLHDIGLKDMTAYQQFLVSVCQPIEEWALYLFVMKWSVRSLLISRCVFVKCTFTFENTFSTNISMQDWNGIVMWGGWVLVAKTILFSPIHPLGSI